MNNQTIARDHFRYWKRVEVRWGDMDAQGHVNNTVYFTYCESARVELFLQTGFRGTQAGTTVGPTLVHASCDFKKQVIYPATLDIGIRVEKIGHRSVKLAYGIFFHGTEELSAIATSVNAWVDYNAGRAVEIPMEIRSALAKYH